MAKEPIIWEKEHPSQGAYTTFFTDRRYRQQYRNPPPAPPFRPPVSRKAVNNTTGPNRLVPTLLVTKPT